MRKLSLINEDLFHKSVEREYTGETRKENWIDGMSLEKFKDYLETVYEPVKKGLEILLHHPDSGMDMCILVPYAENRRGQAHYFYYSGKSIWTFDFGGQGVVTRRLEDRFDVEIDEKYLTHVSLGGEVSNSLFIDVLDFLLDIVVNPALKKRINEDLFHGSLEREYTGETRKENWIEGLTRCEFYDYLKKNYKTYYGRQIILGRDDERILVPITGSRSPLYLFLTYENDRMKDIYYYEIGGSLYMELEKKFDIRRDETIHISSGGKVSNGIALDIIDTIADSVSRPATVRIN